MELGTEHPTKEDEADGSITERMQERKANKKIKRILVKAQPHRPEFCRMQNSGFAFVI